MQQGEADQAVGTRGAALKSAINGRTYQGTTVFGKVYVPPGGRDDSTVTSFLVHSISPRVTNTPKT